MTVAIAVTNPGPEDLVSELSLIDLATARPLPGQFLAPNSATRTFPAGQTTVVQFQWDTTGFAWDDAQQPVTMRRVRVTLLAGCRKNIF